MAELEYEVLHENVYYFPGAIPEIANVMATVEELSSRSVTEWTTWYANNAQDGYPYGDLKTLNVHELRNETDADIKAKSEYVIYSILNTMEQCAIEFMINHGADEVELAELHEGMFDRGAYYGIRRYNESEDMGPHPDRTEDGKDTYTIAVYLDDDYEGGELAIVQPGVGLSIKNKAGSIVVFPSGYLHESKKLLSGRKTILTHVHTTLKPMINF